jgi:plastocyanin
MTRLLIVVALAAFSSAAAAQGVSVTLSEWKLGLSPDTVRAGSVTFRVTNSGTVSHAFYVTGAGVDKGTRDVAAREVATLTLTLKAGTYQLFCPMSEGSHKIAGMARTLVVTAAEATPPVKKPRA